MIHQVGSQQQSCFLVQPQLVPVSIIVDRQNLQLDSRAARYSIRAVQRDPVQLLIVRQLFIERRTERSQRNIVIQIRIRFVGVVADDFTVIPDHLSRCTVQSNEPFMLLALIVLMHDIDRFKLGTTHIRKGALIVLLTQRSAHTIQPGRNLISLTLGCLETANKQQPSQKRVPPHRLSGQVSDK